MPSATTGADSDLQARSALWKAICVAAEDVRHRFRVGAITGVGRASHTLVDPPDVATWQLVEALSLLGVILCAEDATASTVSAFGKSGPIEIVEDGVVRHLWAQHSIRGDWSALSGLPDLVITSSSDLPNPGNVVRVIEAKCVKSLGTHAIRAEFGKAYDLRVSAYLIWSFYTPALRVIEGARGLGIDVEALGFDSAQRDGLLTSPEALISHVTHTQEQVRRTQRFTSALEGAVDEARLKMLGGSD
jgi:hypothetical protein